ncbi:MAG: alpha-amylase [Jatrophihabitantaceae bacterium]
MTGWPDVPAIYEVNTAVWLDELSRRTGRPVLLGEVTAADWDAVCPDGIDAVWLMGVWQRSPAGLEIARDNGELMASFRAALPDLRDEDVIGSPYCVRRYVVDDSFGGPAGLAAARRELAARGRRLVLDYVPNHVAPDHPWVQEHPERFVRGGPEDLADDPVGWLRVGDSVIAHGRDPYFPPWPDVLQLDAFAPELRAAAAATLGDIAEQCDGIRCDMAMLMTNDVFAKTWGGRTGPAPAEEFWPEVIAALRAAHPDTVLLAEAYWDMEWTLQQQGFAFCYDKRLYDRLLAVAGGGPQPVRDHLRAEVGYQARLVRFLENHDEPRVASRAGRELERAAAVTIATLPGATLWHEGQFEGRLVRPPVFLRRRPDEAADPTLAAWYRNLVGSVAERGIRTGDWRLLEATGWPDNTSCGNLLAWTWSGRSGSGPHVVVVNASDQPAEGRVRLPWPELAGRQLRFHDPIADVELDRDGDELLDPGLYVALAAWQYHVLTGSAGF